MERNIEEMTRAELIEELDNIIHKLIDRGRLKYYPFSRNHKYFKLNYLKEGVALYRKKAKEA